MEDLLAQLNEEQKKAVLHDEGPLLILAGAGSGKTRVITYRIAYLIQARGIFPSNILAITFTNKAANEMRERLSGLIGDVGRNMWVGTFHSMFARILRRHAEVLGYTQAYTILDTDDQLKVVKECIKEMELNDKLFAPRLVQTIISKAKNLKGKLQIITGYNDNTVVPQHCLSFLDACVKAGTQPDFFAYPGEEHNMRGHASVHLHERITQYFEDYLK